MFKRKYKYIYIGLNGSKCRGRNIPTGALFPRSPHLLPSLLHFQASFPRSRSPQPPVGEAFPARGDPGNPEQPAAGRVHTLPPAPVGASLVQVAFRAEGQRWATPGQARAPPAARALRGPPRPRRAGASAGRRGL